MIDPTHEGTGDQADSETCDIYESGHAQWGRKGPRYYLKHAPHW